MRGAPDRVPLNQRAIATATVAAITPTAMIPTSDEQPSPLIAPVSKHRIRILSA